MRQKQHTNTNAVMRDVPLKSFMWNKDTQTLSCEASDLGPCRDGQWWLQRLYNDARPHLGIAIRSEKTNRVVRFLLVGVDKSHDGEDIVGWRFEPAHDYTNMPIKHVLIIND